MLRKLSQLRIVVKIQHFEDEVAGIFVKSMILLREALFTSESVKLGHVRSSVRSSVRPDNNCFLRRGYGGCRNAAGHWQFELWILMVLKKMKKDLQKLGLTNGIWWFRDPDLDPVLTMVWIFFSKRDFLKVGGIRA